LVETFFLIFSEILDMNLVCFFFPLGGIDDPLLIILEDSRSDSHNASQCLRIVYVIDQVSLVRELLEKLLLKSFIDEACPK